MITLYTFGPALGLPDPSPFVMKAEILLKLSGQPYETNSRGFRQAPKGKLPYMRDDGELIADSTFIRFHLEKKYGVDFDRGLSAEQRALAWAVEKMCEEHLYWGMVHDRWLIDANFARGPGKFFDMLPAPLRPLIKAMVRRKIRRNLHGHGLGRHSDAERNALMARDIECLAVLVGDKPYLTGATPCAADASVFAFVAGAACQLFNEPMRQAVERHGNLVAYRDRLMQQFYPGFGKA